MLNRRILALPRADLGVCQRFVPARCLHLPRIITARAGTIMWSLQVLAGILGKWRIVVGQSKRRLIAHSVPSRNCGRLCHHGRRLSRTCAIYRPGAARRADSSRNPSIQGGGGFSAAIRTSAASQSVCRHAHVRNDVRWRSTRAGVYGRYSLAPGAGRHGIPAVLVDVHRAAPRPPRLRRRGGRDRRNPCGPTVRRTMARTASRAISPHHDRQSMRAPHTSRLLGNLGQCALRGRTGGGRRRQPVVDLARGCPTSHAADGRSIVRALRALYFIRPQLILSVRRRHAAADLRRAPGYTGAMLPCGPDVAPSSETSHPRPRPSRATAGMPRAHPGTSRAPAGPACASPRRRVSWAPRVASATGATRGRGSTPGASRRWR